MEEKAVVVLARIELTPCRSGLPCGRFLERRRLNRVGVVIVCSQLSSVKSAPLDPPVFNVEVAGAPSCSGALVVSGWQAQSCFTRDPILKTGVEKGGLCLSGLMITACPVRSTTAMFTFDGLNHRVFLHFPTTGSRSKCRRSQSRLLCSPIGGRRTYAFTWRGVPFPFEKRDVTMLYVEIACTTRVL